MDKLFVIGNPIKHSKSPIIHNYWIKKYSLDATYQQKQLEISDLPGMIEKIKRGSIKGFNVTVPFKKEILKFVDVIDYTAKDSMAINTVFVKNKKIIGANTDGIGFVSSLKKDLKLKLTKSSNILCLGAGGAAFGIISELIKLNPNLIQISNRTESAAVELKNHFSSFKSTKFEVKHWGFQPKRNIDLIINTSSYGMKENENACLNIDLISNKSFIYDIIYNPSKTGLLKLADKKGINCSNGMYMLIRQAAESFKRWFNINISTQDILDVKKILTKDD